MAAISVTYPMINGQTNSGTEESQNFRDLVNGLSDGTKDITVNSITSTTQTFILQNGNTLSATVSIGSNDSQSVALRSAGTNRLTIDSSGRMGFVGAVDTSTGLFFDTTSTTTTGTSQTGINLKFIPSTAATVQIEGMIVQTGNQANITTTKRVGFELFNRSKASGSTITTDIVLLINNTSQGTNNAGIADNGAFSGSYFINSTSTNESLLSGDLRLATAGKGLLVKEGSNAKMGTATLNGTTAVVVSTTAVTASSRIFVTHQATGGTVGAAYVDTRTAGTSFSLKSTNAADTSSVAWIIVEPA